MAFSDLPPEVVDSIIHHLSLETKLAPYASISSLSQGAVEKRLLSRLNLCSTDLETFGRIIDSNTHRKAAIRTLTLTVVLPTYTDKACSRFENDDERTANNEAFTGAIGHLFSILSSCDKVDRAQPISLFLGRAYSPMDISHRGAEKRAADKLAIQTNKRADLFDHRYEHSYIQLLNFESLPVVQRVSSITIRSEFGRCLAPVTAVKISSKLPGVQTIEWYLLDRERKYPELRMKLRQDFAEALGSVHFNQEGTSLKLSLMHEAPSNEGYTGCDIRDMRLDFFSALLGDFLRTSTLVKINLGYPICIGPEIFRLAEPQEGASWPCLQEFFVTFSAIRPDGGWYFDRSENDRTDDGDSDNDSENQAEYVRIAAWRGQDIDADTSSSSSGYGTDESFSEETSPPPDSYDSPRERYRQGMSPTRSFRTVPSPELEELLQAAAEATPHMPALRTFAVRAGIQPSARTGWERQIFEFVYAAAGYDNWKDEEVGDKQHRRLTWVAPRKWKASHSLANAWRRTLGSGGIVRYQEW